MALLLALLLFPSLSRAQTIVDAVAKARALQQSADARSPAFSCAGDGDGGVKCAGLLPGGAYPNKVAIFMTSATPPKDAEIILYLHGQGTCEKWLSNSPFGGLLRRSGRIGAILVIPCGQDPWAQGASVGFARFWGGLVQQ